MSEDSRKKFFSGAIVDLGMQKDFEIFSLLAKNKGGKATKPKHIFIQVYMVFLKVNKENYNRDY